jgi:chemotaxis protein methyltransferase CheR
MQTPPLPHALSDKSFLWLRDFFERESGISLRPEKRTLVISRLQKRLEIRALRDFEAYCEMLKNPAEQQERSIALSALTTHETYFFRDPRQFEHLAGKVLGSFPHRPLRLWSAACSTGEEAWSMAMLLADKLGLHGWELVGSDLSDTVLEHAARGLYSMERLSCMPPEFLRRYCRKGLEDYSGQLLISRPLRERVRFCQHNLLASNPALGRFDVIFLRNALIYFDKPRRHQIIEQISAHLNPGGYLYLGESESMIDSPGHFTPAGNSVFRHTPSLPPTERHIP